MSGCSLTRLPRIVAFAAALAAVPALADAQSSSTDLDSHVIATVRAALSPALPYPSSDEGGVMPADGSSQAPWMVRPLQDGERRIEVLANPLNVDNQKRAAKAMVQIEAAI